MKPHLLATAALLSTALYAQDNLIADSAQITNYNLSEVVVSNTTGEMLLGELDAKSKKGSTITADSKAAYYFENSTEEEGLHLKSMLFKVQKVKYKTEARIRFYKKHDYAQEVYMKEGKKTYASFIPGEEIESKDIVIYLEPGQKGIIEIDLLKNGIKLPAEGLFVSLEGVGYYDTDGKAIEGLKSKDLTWIDFHTSTTDNYCGWINPQGTENWFWVNINKWIKSDFEFFEKEVPKKSLTAPNFGLKVTRS